MVYGCLVLRRIGCPRLPVIIGRCPDAFSNEGHSPVTQLSQIFLSSHSHAKAPAGSGRQEQQQYRSSAIAAAEATSTSIRTDGFTADPSMSRPNTRNKGNRSRSEPEEDTRSSILRKIHITGEITLDDLQQLYLLTKPVCNSCRVNSKDNPNCFCGFIPSANGSRKTGLWQRMTDIIKSLGPDPCKDLRQPSNTPAGLTNLGATCYANSILQCLYMNTSFRAGIFSVEPNILKLSPVLDELSRLFAQLHSSKMAFIDSAPLIKTLELDNSIQQDSHEFLTLFLSLLERSLRHSKAVEVRNMVQNLYCGRVSHVTQCSVCGRESDASSKLEDFYGLELNIDGLNNLSESIAQYLSLEKLNGDNQYFCESCGQRVDATRCIKLHELPAILTFQLKRYVFHPKTTTRKKLTSSFSFPMHLDMDPIMGCPDASESSLIYDLAAILIHKGTAVHSGHYVAHIKDTATGLWWEFDDEQVSLLGEDPFGKGLSTPSGKACAVQQIDHPGGFMHDVSNGSCPPTSLASNCRAAISDEMFSSTDAYMLMYNHMKVDKENTRSCDSSERNTENVAVSLPIHLFEEIQKLNTLYTNTCEEYQLKKESHNTVITERRQEVKSVLAEAPVYSPEEQYFWISTEWLRQWADSISPSYIDNSAVQCSHGKLPVSKINSVKRVSQAAWKRLLSKYGGGPTLCNEDACLDCIKCGAKDAMSADDYRHRRTSLIQYAEQALAGNCSESSVESLYYVSRSWLVHWLRRKKVESPNDADVGPTGSLRCPHGGLLPEHASGAKRVVVPENLWSFLYETANSVKTDDDSGCLTFPFDTRPCEVCCKELSESASKEDCLRTAKMKQRQNHEKLFQGKNLSLYPGFKYFLIPSRWLVNWRAYVTTASSGKNISSTEEPENLEVCIESFMCKKHMQLIERPPELVCKHDTISQQSSAEDVLTVIPEDDWNLFCEEWNMSSGKGIIAEIVMGKNISHDVAGSCEDLPIAVETEISNDEENMLHLRHKPFIKTVPEICNECIGERESSELMRKLSYYNEDIYVFLVSGKEPPKSLLSSSTGIQKLDRRTSKRSRKTRVGNSVNLKVSCSTSVYELKMMIWESFGIVKENQRLHKGLIEIEDDNATLADKNIFPEDNLWVTDSGIYENRDIAEELYEGKLQMKQAEGFHGTLLYADVDIEEPQDINV